MATAEFVFGIDLDGVCADFYAKMREVFAEWRDVDVSDLTEDVTYGLPEWSLLPGEYDRIHRFAVTQRDLFTSMKPVKGAAQSIRRLGTEGVRIRIITHRLFIRHFHQMAVSQTVRWLDAHAIPYWDLCFMRDKALVDADIYIEDTEKNIRDLEACGREVIAFTNSTNRDMHPAPVTRADAWEDAERIVRERYYEWRTKRKLPLPAAPGHAPPAPTRPHPDNDGWHFPQARCLAPLTLIPSPADLDTEAGGSGNERESVLCRCVLTHRGAADAVTNGVAVSNGEVRVSQVARHRGQGLRRMRWSTSPGSRLPPGNWHGHALCRAGQESLVPDPASFRLRCPPGGVACRLRPCGVNSPAYGCSSLSCWQVAVLRVRSEMDYRLIGGELAVLVAARLLT